MFYEVLSPDLSKPHFLRIFDIGHSSKPNIVLSSELHRTRSLLLCAEFCVVLLVKHVRLRSFIFLNAFLLAHSPLATALVINSLCWLAYGNSVVEFFEHQTCDTHTRWKFLLPTISVSHPQRHLSCVSYTWLQFPSPERAVPRQPEFD